MLKTAISRKPSLKVADEVWIATALLHRENPRRQSFEVHEIVDRAVKEHIARELRPGVYVHAVQHCVANRPPNPGRYRLLYETEDGERRLFRYPDAYHSAREGGKTIPRKEDIPAEYRDLLDWYASEYALKPGALEQADTILGLLGLGKEIWAGEDPDEYVRRLREGWE